MPSFGHLDKTAHLFVHLTRPTPNSGPLRNLLPGISAYPQKLRPGGTLFFGTTKSRDPNLDRVPDQGGFRSTLKPDPWWRGVTQRLLALVAPCLVTLIECLFAHERDKDRELLDTG